MRKLESFSKKTISLFLAIVVAVGLAVPTAILAFGEGGFLRADPSVREVRTADEFRAAIMDASVATIVMKNNIDLNDVSKKNVNNVADLAHNRVSDTLTIDGGNFTLTEYNAASNTYPHTHYNFQLHANSKAVQEVVIKNVNIVGYSVWGLVAIHNSNRTLKYENVNYTGPQPAYVYYGTLHIKDSVFKHVWRSKYNTIDQGEIGGEATQVLLEGRVHFENKDVKEGAGKNTTFTNQNEVFWMQKGGSRPYEIRFLQNADVTVDIETGGGKPSALAVETSGLLYWDLNGSMVMEEGAKLNYEGNWGVFNVHHPMDLTLASGAELNVHTTGSAKYYNHATFDLRTLTMQEGSQFHVVAEKNGNYPAVRFRPYVVGISNKTMVNLDNPKSILWYSEGGVAYNTYGDYQESFLMELNKATYWRSRNDVTLEARPLYDGDTASRYYNPKITGGYQIVSSDTPAAHFANVEEEDTFTVAGTFKKAAINNGITKFAVSGYDDPDVANGAQGSITAANFAPGGNQVFEANGYYVGDTIYSHANVNYYKVDGDGNATLDAAEQLRAAVGKTVSVTPDKERYLPLNEEGEPIAGEKPTHMLELARSNTANVTYTPGEDGTVSIVLEQYNEGETPVISFYYAQDANGNEIPDYQEASIEQYHAYVDETGAVTTSNIVKFKTYADVEGAPGTGEAGFIQAYGPEGGEQRYIFDLELSIRENGPSSVVPRENITIELADGKPTARFTFGEYPHFVFVFALDADGDNIPDYKQAKTVEKYARLDGTGALVSGDPIPGPTHTGVYGEQGRVALSSEVKSMFASLSGTGADNYVFDVDMTLARNAVEGLTLTEDEVLFRYGLNPSFVLFYALDENGDGIPDYKGAYATEYTVYLNEKGQEIGLAATQPTPVNSGGEYRVPARKKTHDYTNAAGETVQGNFAFDDIASALLNGGMAQPDGSVWIPDREGASFSYYFVYGLDEDDNGTPDYRENETHEMHIKLDGAGQATATVDANTYTGAYGAQGSVRVYPNLYRSTSLAKNYVLDRDATLINNLENGVLLEDIYLYFVFGVNKSVTIFYALDADGDGTPDYRQENATGLTVYVDGDGAVLDSVWSAPVSVVISDSQTTAYSYDTAKTLDGKTYLFDEALSAELNGVAVAVQGGKLILPASGEPYVFYMVYALDENGDGIPDYKQKFASGFDILLDENGRVGKTIPLARKVIGDSGLLLNVEADRYVDYDGHEYMLDIEETQRLNQAEGHTVTLADPNTISIAAGEHAKYYIVYALNEDEDTETPDYKAKYLTGHHTFLDGEENEVESRAVALPPVVLPGTGRTVTVDAAQRTAYETDKYIFDDVATRSYNAAHNVQPSTGAVSAIAVGGGAGKEYHLVYALDADGEGTPDYRQDTVLEYYTLLDSTGAPEEGGAQYLQARHTGEEGLEKTVPASPHAGYTFDKQKTLQMNNAAVAGMLLTVGDTDARFTFGEGLHSFVMVYARDTDGDGKPDYQKAETKEVHVLLDGSAVETSRDVVGTLKGEYGAGGELVVVPGQYNGYIVDWAATRANAASESIVVDEAGSKITFRYGVTPQVVVYYALRTDGITPDYQKDKAVEYHVYIDADGEMDKLEIDIHTLTATTTFPYPVRADYIPDVGKTEQLNADTPNLAVVAGGVTVEATGTARQVAFYLAVAYSTDGTTPDYKLGRADGWRILYDGEGIALEHGATQIAADELIVPGGLEVNYDAAFTDTDGNVYAFDETKAAAANGGWFNTATKKLVIPDTVTGRVEYVLPYGLDSDGDGTPDYYQNHATETRLFYGAKGSVVNRETDPPRLINTATGLAVNTADIDVNGDNYVYDSVATQAENTAVLAHLSITATGMGVNKNAPDLAYNVVFALDADGDGTPDYRQHTLSGTAELYDGENSFLVSRPLADILIHEVNGANAVAEETYSYLGRSYVFVRAEADAPAGVDGRTVSVAGPATAGVSYKFVYALDSDGDGSPDYGQHKATGTLQVIDEDGEELYSGPLGTVLIRKDGDTTITPAATYAYGGNVYDLMPGQTLITPDEYASVDQNGVLTIRPEADADVSYTLVYGTDGDGDGTPDNKQHRLRGDIVLWDDEARPVGQPLPQKDLLIRTDRDTEFTAAPEMEQDGVKYIFVAEASEAEAPARITETGIMVPHNAATGNLAYRYIYAADENGDNIPDYKQDKFITAGWVGTMPDGSTRGLATKTYEGPKGTETTINSADATIGSGWVLDTQNSPASVTVKFGYDTEVIFHYTYDGDAGDQIVDMREYALLLDETGVAEEAPGHVRTHTGAVGTSGDTAAQAPAGYVYDAGKTRAMNTMASFTANDDGSVAFTYGMYPSFVLVYARDAVDGEGNEGGDGIPDYKQARSLIWHVQLDGDGVETGRSLFRSENGEYGAGASASAAEARYDGHVYDHAMTQAQNADTGMAVDGETVHFTIGKNGNIYIYYAADGDEDGKPDYGQDKASQYTLWLDEKGVLVGDVQLTVHTIPEGGFTVEGERAATGPDGRNYTFDVEAAAALNGGLQDGHTITIPYDIGDVAFYLVYALDEKGAGGGDGGDEKPDYKQRFATGYELLLDENGDAAQIEPLGLVEIPESGLAIGYGEAKAKYAGQGYLFDDKGTEALNRYLGNSVDTGAATLWVPYVDGSTYYLVYALDGDENEIPDYRQVTLTAEWVKVAKNGSETVAELRTYEGEMGEPGTIDSAEVDLGKDWKLNESKSGTTGGKLGVVFGQGGKVSFYYDEITTTPPSSSDGDSTNPTTEPSTTAPTTKPDTTSPTTAPSTKPDTSNGDATTSRVEETTTSQGGGSTTSDGGGTTSGGGNGGESTTSTNQGGGDGGNNGGDGTTSTTTLPVTTSTTSSSSSTSRASSSSTSSSGASSDGNGTEASGGGQGGGQDGSTGATTSVPGGGLLEEDETPGKTNPPTINPPPPGGEELGGTGQPGSVITITWPDGSTSSVTVDESGSWSVSVPGGVSLKPGDVISATAKVEGEEESEAVYALVVGENGEGIVSVFGNDIPLGSFTSFNTWSLLNLLLSVLALVAAAVLLVLNLLRRKGGARLPLVRWLAMALGVLPVLLFLVVEDLSAQIALLNRHTPLFLLVTALYAAAIVVAHILNRRGRPAPLAPEEE